MKKKLNFNIILYLLLLLALAAAVWQIGRRVLREEQNKKVEVICDFADAVRLARVDGLGTDEVLGKLKASGCVSIGLAEETLDGLQDEGRVSLAAMSDLKNSRLIITADGPGLAERIFINLARQLGTGRVRKTGTAGLVVRGGLSPFSLSQSQEDRSPGELVYPEGLENLGLGVDPAKAALIKQAGLGLVLRLRNSRWLSGRAIAEKIAELKKDFPRAEYMIFAEDEVLGYPANLPAAARAVKSAGLNFGLIEFSRQSGESALARQMGGNVASVHSLTPEEMTGMTLDRALARWLRAARERGVRLFYVHPFPRLDQINRLSGQNLTEENVFYLENLSTWLKENGFVLGPAKVSQTVGRPLRVGGLGLALLTLGAGVYLVFLIRYLGFFSPADLKRFAAVFIPGLAVIAVAAFLAGRGVVWQKMAGWLLAVAAPALAVISCFDHPARLRRGRNFLWAVVIILRSVCIALIGAVLLSAFLSQDIFLLRIDQFSGVKLALVLPFLIVTYYFWRDTSWEIYFRRILQRPLSLGFFLGLLFFLAAAALFLARSGNYLSGAVWPAETAARRGLEIILGVRPRTKEFLLGYPALLLAVTLAAGGHRRLVIWFWTMIGLLAPVSLVNTFCHLHTPLLVSLRRSFNGLVLGLIFGLILVSFFNLLAAYRRRRREESMPERTAPLPFKS